MRRYPARPLLAVLVAAVLALLLAACSDEDGPTSTPTPHAPSASTDTATSAQAGSTSLPSPGTGEGREGATPVLESPHAAATFTPTDASTLELVGIEGWLNSEALTL